MGLRPHGFPKTSGRRVVSPVFAFLIASRICAYVDMSTWAVCHRYEFTNLRVPEPHYLLVASGETHMPAARVCYGDAGLG